MTQHPLGGPPADYEKTDANLSAVVRVGAGIALVSLLVAALLIPVSRALVARQAKSDPAAPPIAGFEPGRQAPGPRLQGEPFTDWRTMKARQEALITSYGWVDEANGVTHIPIDQAMKMLTERGLPTRSAESPAPAPSAPPSPGAGGHP